jgi:hypothetical protein
VGSIAHAVLQKVASGSIKAQEEIQLAWEANEKDIENKLSGSWIEHHFVPLSLSARYYEVKKKQCLKLAKSLISHGLPYKSTRRTRRDTVEKWYETPDSMVGGYIDKILDTPEGDVIVDYKTGKVLEDETGTRATIKEAYSEQLKLYAALYYTKHKTWPASLMIISLDCQEYTISFTPEKCLDLLNNARQLLLDINYLIEKGTLNNIDLVYGKLARPSPLNCQLCLYRPACKSYWVTRDEAPNSYWPNDICGVVTDKRLLGNGLLLIKINGSGKEHIVRGLHPSRHIALTGLKNNTIVCSLRHDRGGSYSETNLTTIYMIAPD